MVAVVRVHQTGGPEMLRYEDIPAKEPGQGEIKIKQTAIGLNYIDTYFRSGLYPAQLPFIAGNEGAGVVTAVGPGVKGIKKGDRVAYVHPRRLRRRARAARRARGENSAEDRRQDRGRDDAEGHDRAISPPPHLQGEEGRHHSRPRRGGRRRPDPVPVGQGARRHRHRHRRLEAKKPKSPRRMARTTPFSTTRKIGSRASPKSPRARNATWSMTASARPPSWARSIA